jgi:putative ATPase
MSLFGVPGSDPFEKVSPDAPLAERMRPRSLEEVVGQEHLVGDERALTRLVKQGRIPSLIFWGPPGCGKTTLARVLAAETGSRFVATSAVIIGIKDVRAMVEEAKHAQRNGQHTLLFLDEIHRFNKAQQDAFLPHVENGLITLLGATTENPSFEVNAALLSRCRVFTLNPLGVEDIERLVDRAMIDEERGLGGKSLTLAAEARGALVAVAGGDARAALTALDAAAASVGEGAITEEIVIDVCQSGAAIHYDKGGEEHYNLISALHKSVRGSDPQAALYWLARMLEGGADLMYVARRLVRMASEDIGNADPQALGIALAAKDAAHFLGLPEANVALAQVTVYLSTAPKSNASELAYNAAAELARSTSHEPVPLHIRNAPTRLMKDLGYGKRYHYDHDHPDAYAGQSFLPESLDEPEFYRPNPRGFEREIEKRLQYWKSLKRARNP